MADDLDKMLSDAEAATPEHIIGTVVGAMMKLRPGKNHHTEEVANQVVQQLDILREVLRQRYDRLKAAEAALREIGETATEALEDEDFQHLFSQRNHMTGPALRGMLEIIKDAVARAALPDDDPHST